jgi:hypothetical protein
MPSEWHPKCLPVVTTVDSMSDSDSEVSKLSGSNQSTTLNLLSIVSTHHYHEYQIQKDMLNEQSLGVQISDFFHSPAFTSKEKERSSMTATEPKYDRTRTFHMKSHHWQPESWTDSCSVSQPC